MSKPVTLSAVCGFSGRVDAAKGILYGVRLATVGPARGHGVWLDVLFLQQVVSYCQSRGVIKCKADHWSPFLATVGTFINFRLDTESSPAAALADLELFECDPDTRAKILELAAKCPNEIGVSLTFWPDESDHDDAAKREYARVKEVDSADLVDEPAANPGLFQRGAVDSASQKNKPHMSTKPKNILPFKRPGAAPVVVQPGKQFRKGPATYAAPEPDETEDEPDVQDDGDLAAEIAPVVSELQQAVAAMATAAQKLADIVSGGASDESEADPAPPAAQSRKPAAPAAAPARPAAQSSRPAPAAPAAPAAQPGAPKLATFGSLKFDDGAGNIVTLQDYLDQQFEARIGMAEVEAEASAGVPPLPTRGANTTPRNKAEHWAHYRTLPANEQRKYWKENKEKMQTLS